MTTKAQENARWRKEKTPVVRQYQAEQKKAYITAAARGFSNQPGFLYDWQTAIETDAKLKLSGINYQILQETINQELKQAGIDYDLAFKNAQISWEQEKAELLTEWEKELSLVKQGMADDEEALNRLALEVSKRQTDMIEAKAAIDLQKEEYQLH